ncbi:hypothetical protein LZ023_36690 (plasmid) [Pseudomonas silvicola]|nr:hypothetical protein LZ023_36690 [Pseudomonas silvicola]
MAAVLWRVDELGVLKVGPESAGSTPGPVCYGRGGTQPTITDAFVSLGILGQATLGYNAVNVDVAAAKAAIQDRWPIDWVNPSKPRRKRSLTFPCPACTQELADWFPVSVSTRAPFP